MEEYGIEDALLSLKNLPIGEGSFRTVYLSSGGKWVYKFPIDALHTEPNRWEHSFYRELVEKSGDPWPDGVSMPECHILEIEDHGPVLAAKYVQGSLPPKCTKRQCKCPSLSPKYWDGCWKVAAKKVTFELDDVVIQNGKLMLLDMGQ